MQTLFTLNTLIDDILLTIRNNNISESEDLSRMQIEQWIHYYRAMLIKQDLDKGRSPNPSYFQTLYNLTLVEVPADPIISCTGCSVNMDTVQKTTNKVPSPIDLHFGTGILQVTDAGNNPIQYMPRARRSFQFERKYTKYDPTYYYENHYIYVHSIL